MKKVFLFLSAISFVASSCSDENPVTPPVDTSTGVLVKRVVTQQDDPEGFNYQIDYTYDGNKLVQGVWDDGTIEKFYYTGDLITKVEFIDAGVVTYRDIFTYNPQGKLIQYKSEELTMGWESITNYMHNSDNTITVSGENDAVITLQNGEISQVAYSGPYGRTYNYTLDTKNSPYKNVTGYAEIAYAFDGDYELHGRARNILSIVNEEDNLNYTVNTMQYNANNYPTVVTSSAIFDYNYPNYVEELTTVYSYE